jgi:hypothetical protein
MTIRPICEAATHRTFEIALARELITLFRLLAAQWDLSSLWGWNIAMRAWRPQEGKIVESALRTSVLAG